MIPVVALLFKPEYCYFLLNVIIKKTKYTVLEKQHFLKKSQVIVIFLLTCIFHLINGLAFFFLISSFVEISVQDLLFVVVSFILAGVTGTLAIFSPGGIGIKEGAIVYFLQFILPASIAVLISVIARVWVVMGELVALLVVFVIDKYNNIHRSQSVKIIKN